MLPWISTQEQERKPEESLRAKSRLGKPSSEPITDFESDSLIVMNGESSDDNSASTLQAGLKLLYRKWEDP